MNQQTTSKAKQDDDDGIPIHHDEKCDNDDGISVHHDEKYDDDDISIHQDEIYDDDEDPPDSDFDWDDVDSEEEEEPLPQERHCCLCLTRSSSKLSWICFIIMTAISVAVCIAVFITVKPQTDPTMVSYNLALWFTFIAFMFCVTLATQMVIEILPWLIKNIAAIVTPMKTEVLRAKLAYYNDIRSYTKLLVIGAWTWGSWSFLRRELDLPEGSIRPDYVRTLELVWEIFFLFTLFLFIEKFILQIIVTTFHKKAYGDRLAKNQRALRILDKLKRAKGSGEFLLKRIYNKRNRKEDDRTVRFRDVDTMISIPPIRKQEGLIDSMSKNGRQGFLENVSKQLKNHDQSDHPKIARSNSSISSITTDTDKSSSLFSGYRKLAQESAFQDPVHQAKQLARHIFYNILGTHPSRQYVLETDLYPYFRTKEDAKEAFNLFDADDNGNISRREMRAGCIRIYRDRQDLAKSMRDMSQATGTLDILLLVIFICIWVVVAMTVFGVNVGTQLTPLWSAFIAASFIFGNSARNAFESIIFVFVTHPFDTGDRILIEDDDWVVSNVGIMVSTFINLDGSIVYAKNSILATKYIINCRRTGRTSETFDLQVSYYTPSWKIQKLRDYMVEWNNKHPKLYTKDACGVNIITFEKLDRITLTFFFQHTKNWQDAAGRWLRHNNFLLELKGELERLNIFYKLPEQPVIYRYYGDEKIPDDLDDDEPHERGPWNNTSKIQNQAGASNGGVGVSGEETGGDSGAGAGAAATVALTTGAF